ncbi:MAG: TIGR00730 family Rossman fold protein [Chloroflexi bacterium]|nr:TIGR00730 family Rossman fold protein [Chloroflexota bacterium]
MDLKTNEGILKELEAVVASEEHDLRSFLYREMVLNVLKSKRDELDLLDLKVLNRAIAEFRYAAKTFKPYRGTRKVSIYGSARTPTDDPYFDLAVTFGRKMAEAGFMAITGSGEGIMRAGIEGAGAENSFGVNILLPFEQMPAAVIQDDPKLITFRYFFTRKLFFVMEADAFALFPGGFGTMDESFETLTLLQTGKATPSPLVLMELPGEDYWETWDDFVQKQLLGQGYISEQDLSLYKIAHTPEEGVKWILSYYSTYHSTRQVRDKLIIRTMKTLTDEHIERLNDRFSNLVGKGKIERVQATNAEQDEPELADLPRIGFVNDRKKPGLLNQMILTINEMGKELTSN